MNGEKVERERKSKGTGEKGERETGRGERKGGKEVGKEWEGTRIQYEGE